MKGIVIDDEKIARTIIRELSSQVENVSIVADFSEAISAIKYLNSNKVDFIFLDIHMPKFNGFDFIESLNVTPKIVLTTSDKEQSLKAFRYKFIVDYLLKPLDLESFKKSIEKLNSIHIIENDSNNNIKNVTQISYDGFMFVNVYRRLVKINFKDIYLIESSGNYINIKTKNSDIRVNNRLKNILEKLPQKHFIKIHKSFIININYIIDIEDNSVLLNKQVIPISKKYRLDLNDRLNLL